MAVYAAYGSNMDPGQMALRAPHSPLRGTGWLDGWRLTFGGEDVGWEGPLATLVEDAGYQVFIALYDVTEYDEISMDRWEHERLRLESELGERITLDALTGPNGLTNREPWQDDAAGPAGVRSNTNRPTATVHATSSAASSARPRETFGRRRNR